MATPADQRDIEEAFHAYDTKFEGQISLETILVIFLGLGYQPDNITLQNLQARSGNKKHLNLQETMDVLRQVSPACFKSRVISSLLGDCCMH